jgi:hypothetical protein
MDLLVVGLEGHEGDWYWVRQLAVGTGTNIHAPIPNEFEVRVHPNAFAEPLANAVGWSEVWSMSGQFSLFVATPPPGYVFLSDLYSGGTNYDVNDQMKCVSMDCVKPASIGPLIWNDQGSGAKRNGSVWGIDGGDTGDWRPFVATSGYDRPNRNVYILNMDVVEVVG